MSHPRTGKSRSVTADNVIQHGAVAVKMLRDIAEAVNAPYLKPIAGVSLLIFDTVQVSIWRFINMHATYNLVSDNT